MDIEQMRIRMGEMTAENARLQSIIGEANAQDAENEPLVYIRKNTREWIDTVKPFMSARFEMQFRTDDALEEYCIPLFVRPIPAQQSPVVAVPDGCRCQECSTYYRADLIVEDHLWEVIKPADKTVGSGLLCPNCISEKIVSMDGVSSVLGYPNNSPRITEQDALIVLEGFHAMYNRHAWRHFYASWIKSAEYLAILNKLNDKPEKDYPEDAAQENGNYENTCVHCLGVFTGNKHRRVCKVCDKPESVGG